ncbi:MAG TPA: adenylate/guanylate cyclase domain-containing protein [Thermodesulfovibrionales bacterium]|nr:adenylate/guanylate cyclase domain-containing protein [Thermodesulfovibrionales bacterium]
MNALRNVTKSPLLVSLIIGVIISLGIIALRNSGALESIELIAYDWTLRSLPQISSQESPVVLIKVTEDDISDLGQWPLTDASVARALEMLLRCRPRVIGLDIYRDMPIPPGTSELERILLGNENIITVMKFGDKEEHGILPIAALRETERVGFNDILVDPGGIVRRGLLFLDDGENTFYSFALRVALLYLKEEGIRPQPDASNPQFLRLGKTTIPPFGHDEGAYVESDARGYQFLLDFRGARLPFRSFALASLISDRVPAEALKDKVVLIGTATESVKDFFYTPYSRGLHFSQQITGIELHGYIISQLLRFALKGSRPISAQGNWCEGLWIVIWGIMGGVIGSRVRSPWSFSILASAGILILVLSGYLALMNSWWIPLIPPVMAWLFSSTVVTAYMSNKEKRERIFLMQLFSKHVSREVAETIWNEREQFLDGGRLRSQKLIVTVIFTDLKGFTAVSEKLDPQTLINWLNTYLEAMARLVIEHGGVVDDYIGDGLKADFGVPLPRTSEAEIAKDALSAVNCALAMEREMSRLNSVWHRENLPTACMRIGIFTGPVVAGSLGSSERLKFTTIGDTINVASRLENFDKDHCDSDPIENPCRILIGDSTLHYLDNRFRTEKVGDVSLRGKEQRIAVFRLFGRPNGYPDSNGQEGRL